MSWPRRAHHALSHSLKLRLIALFLLLALAMAAIFFAGMRSALSSGWRDAARPLIADYVDRLAAEIGTPPSIERAQALVERLPLSVQISGPVVNWHSPMAWPGADRFDHDQHLGSDEPRLFERNTADGHHMRFGLSAAVWNDRPRYIGWITLAAMLLLTALAYARVRRMLQPLEAIRDGAQRFGAGDFSRSITLRHAGRNDELSLLAATINTMGADIGQMLDAKRNLLLAISHELRSPLTRARVNVELLPETPDLREPREALLRDLALMRDLINDLLESERLASRHAMLQREPVRLDLLVGQVVADLPPQSAPPEVITQPVAALLLDLSRVRLLLRNLLDNALRHSAQAPRAPQVRVLAMANAGVQLEVRDFGPGVPDDQLASLTEPFYRTDAARERGSGGVGLGLYLCKSVVLAHGGSLTIDNAHPGLKVVVQFPPDKAAV
jgi:signal transduction histidine kinase